MKRILVVDDDPMMVSAIVKGFELAGLQAQGTAYENEVLDRVEQFKPDLLVLDIFFGHENKKTGMDILKNIRERWDKASLPVFMITGKGGVSDFNESMDLGADDFIIKPFKIEELVENVSRTLERTSQAANSISKTWKEEIVGKSPAIISVLKKLRKAANDRSDILILGETGVGKDLIAKEYYRLSQWCKKPLRVIYCTNFATDTLFESELFGHKRGSFTNAYEDKKGLLHEADGGMAFLNEIGEISPQQQAKILELVDNKTIRPLGSNNSIQLKVVLVMATNCDLKQMVERGEFRRDLYRRLCQTVIIEVPPLRERLEDIPLLVDYFILEINQTALEPIRTIDKDVIDYFESLRWEGNIGELKNCIREAGRRCLGGRIILKDVKGYIERHKIRSLAEEKIVEPLAELEVDFKTFRQQALKTFEKRYFEHHLAKHDHSISSTAKAIGIKQRQQLYQILKRLGIKNVQ